MADAPRWQFYVDRGGTFTDCIGRDPATGALSVVKVPSSDDAPLLGIRRLLGLSDAAPIPACEVRLGTTLGTNALLERRGARSALLLTRGFGDLLELGDQTRPDLFALRVVKAAPLSERVAEVAERLDANGQVLERSSPAELASLLSELRAGGIDSLGVVVLNDYREGRLERELAELARAAGLSHVATGFEVAPGVGYLTRASSTAIDAYVTPLLRRYLTTLAQQLPGSRLLLMQSSGGLCERERFRGVASVLSGPAGGAEALAAVARLAGLSYAVGLDMGGTSTDVTRVADGVVARLHETEVAGARIAAPMVAVHTVAAGGGSVCQLDGERLRVGPLSVGSNPGPLCYSRPGASQLSLSDVNLVLGRLLPDRFPLPLSADAPRAALEAISAELGRQGHPYTALDVAEGFFEIANANMVEAIREVTVGRGFDVREHALVVFGGAGGQHACALARELDVREVLFHPLSGVLSAWGIGISRLTWEGSRDAGGRPLDGAALQALAMAFEPLLQEGRASLVRDGASLAELCEDRYLGVRYAGTEAVLEVELRSDPARLAADFEAAFAARFGYVDPSRRLEIAVIRARLAERRAQTAASRPPAAPTAAPVAVRATRLRLGGRAYDAVPVYFRESLAPGTELRGPAIIAEATGTIVLEPDFVLHAAEDGLLRVVHDTSAAVLQPSTAEARAGAPDPVRLELYANRFMSIAEQMGGTLRQTASSVNIRERLDFSCAVFDAAGELIANAPHIPVHLGAMSESVKAVMRAHRALERGDIFVTNDPAQGGSHLPDITLVAPVHDGGVLRFFAAARGHHADVGGTTPGSMPAFSRSLDEEGIVLRCPKVGTKGYFDRELLRSLFSAGALPARRIEENLADLGAQLAAVQTGARLLLELGAERGMAQVTRYMDFVQDNAAREVERALSRLPPGKSRFVDRLDDGTAISVTLEVADGRLTVDFTGTGPEHAGNLNAPRAVTLACVLYFLRVLVGKPIPLNSGCLRRVHVVIPEPSLLAPGPTRAVAGGNVETSQRVVDVLLGAARLLAASQGTMNNLSFGDGSYGYYETIAGGAGAGRDFAGAHAVHTHMTNTRITDAEVMERRFPVRVVEHARRRASGGSGAHDGGDGVRRTIEFRAPALVSILSERRAVAPFGLDGGGAGARGHNSLNGRELPGAASFEVKSGDRLTLLTPGGGGYGPPPISGA